MKIGAANAAQVAHEVVHGNEGGVVQGAHSFEHHDAGLLGGIEHGACLALVRAQRLLDDHVLAARDAGEGLRHVECVGASEIHGVYLVAGGEILELGEGA